MTNYIFLLYNKKGYQTARAKGEEKVKRTEFNEEVISIISDSANQIHKQEGFVGDKTYELSLYAKAENKGKNDFYLTVSDEGVLVCIKNIKEDIDKISAEKSIEDLGKRITRIFSEKGVEAEISNVMAAEEDAEMTTQPIMLKISGDIGLSDEKFKKRICSELNDWLDELKMMMGSSSKKDTIDYKKEYDSLMAGNKIYAKETDSDKDYSYLMAAITLIATVIAAFTYKMLAFQTMGLMAGGFSAYRCFVNKNWKGFVISLVCVIVCAVLLYLGYKDTKTSIFKNSSESIAK